MNTLTATKRSKTEKLANIRNNGMVPAVVYGAQVENTPISVSSVDFIKLLKVVGETNTIVLEIDDSKTKKKIDVLIHNIQVHPIYDQPIHIDFLAVDMNKLIEVKIPIEFIGKAKAEKDSPGVLVKALYELEIEALPKDIPNKIEVDVTILELLDSQIRVNDIKLPTGVKMITDGDETVALIAAIKEEEIETPKEEVDLSSIEVEKKGKKEEGGESTEENKDGKII